MYPSCLLHCCDIFWVFLCVWLFAESGVLELKLKALILDIIHNIDVVKQLNQAQVHSVEAWAWKKQLRFYMKDQKCYIQMVDAELQYTYEYQVWYFKVLPCVFYVCQTPHFTHVSLLLPNYVMSLILKERVIIFILDTNGVNVSCVEITQHSILSMFSNVLLL